MNQPGDTVSAWESKRYIPKPGEPELPPQLAVYAQKSTDEIIDEFNRMPFFMNKLDETDGEGGENVQLEALKSLAYEGPPEEIATNFKNQGNECFKAGQWQDALQYYTQGLDVDAGLDALTVALYLNRAACNLKLKNYRRCIEDCKRAMQIDELNVKACFRAGQAFLAVDRLEEARKILEYGLSKDAENKPIRDTLAEVEKKELLIEEQSKKKKRLADEKKLIEQNLSLAIKLRGIEVIHSLRPTEFLDGAVLKLEDPMDVESQLVFPAMILYPTIDEFDYVAEVGELTEPADLLRMLLDRPKEWFADPKRKNFNLKSLQCYLETSSGGLVKIGKKAAINSALMAEKVKAPLFDNGLRLYVVPKEEFEDWVQKWNKEEALSKRA
ncbi:hypothetical protein PUMCH_001905 [Australozyma saopauloensis]|uniref:Cns1/TTC4 wheel domain-containing protein n=1 Tax=Australozyma saopauloensis TaxID=291208 RepID=A0AAX4H7Q1_9ASCO|nr:hypothetical protein PUMCH_001905 [[Candida] saopauloensis]